MADQHRVNLSTSGPPRTVLNTEPPEALAALEHALADTDPRAALVPVAGQWPSFLDGWARLGQNARDDAEAYAFFRVGYHRGLDRLRQNGWRGSGYVPWEHEENRGFLRCVEGLRMMADRIGESEEAERCAVFLRQLDPSWPPSQLD